MTRVTRLSIVVLGQMTHNCLVDREVLKALCSIGFSNYSAIAGIKRSRCKEKLPQINVLCRPVQVMLRRMEEEDKETIKSLPTLCANAG